MANILLIEDDELLSNGVCRILERENHYVKMAYSLKEAYDSCIQEFDLVLLDVMLPDGDGLYFCKEVRKKSNVPIIFLTCCNDESSIVTGLDQGGDDYITKPFRLKELVSRINAVLRRKSSVNHHPQKLVSGDIEASPEERTFFKSKVQLQLTPIEADIILFLMQNPMIILTRERLLSNIWDIDGEFINDNTLSVHIRRLREKIEEDPSNPLYIITVRGIGYKWGCETMRGG